MSETGTVSDLLEAQSERRLAKMRDGIAAEINRLGTELRLVDDALNKKRKAKQRTAPAAAVGQAAEHATAHAVATKRNGAGHFNGLSRRELLANVAEMDRPVRAPEVQRHLLAKGIERKVEAVRVGLARLVRDQELIRHPDGTYVVASSNGHAPGPEAEAPLPPGTLGFDS